MVTAIVIPIICIYFYWITKKEMKVKDQEWIESGFVSEESLLTGHIESIHYEKQRFYYHRFVLIQKLNVRNEGKITIAKKTLPFSKNLVLDEFQQGNFVRLYGAWDKSIFLINRIEKIN